MSGSDKAMTLRLPKSLAADLAMVAAVDDLTQTEVIRLALGLYIDTRRVDPEFRALAEQMTARLADMVGEAS